ncbi:MAG: hypothetical protein RLZZ399_700 [Verrucomicrobiota bacterium]|jgi:tetratricopeptide (TPR) repeat protein/predicted Ser/Thr protein kinase
MNQAMMATEEEAALRRKETPSIESLAPHFPQLEIVEVLGRGGMGVVYKARQRSLNRWVALKLLAPERAADPEFAARFEKEALALAALNHPNIVAVYDFGESGGFFYLLMEFVDGANLRQLLSAKQFTPEEALSIVPPICEALQCAHERGIVHRDIKPENLLIDRTGVVKIADFGIAKLVGTGVSEAPGAGTGSNPPPVDSKTQWAGTPDYAAPEQRQPGALQDHRADIYSLGVVLYELLTGERPGAAPLDAPLRKIRVDFRVDEILLRALEKEPELRFPTATEFRERVLELGASAGSRAGVAPESPGLNPQGAVVEGEQRTRGWRLPAIVAGMAALLLLGAGLLHFGKPGRSDFGKIRVEAVKATSAFPMPKPFPVEGSLGIGSVAPFLEPEAWIQGKAVKRWEPGKVYLVFFYGGENSVLGGEETADRLRLFTESASEFAASGLIPVAHFEGQSVEEARSALGSFGVSPKINVAFSAYHAVAVWARWIEAAGFWKSGDGTGILYSPIVFLINQEGRIAWMGDLEALPKTLIQSVLEGSLDLSEAAGQFVTRQREERYAGDLERQFFRDLSLKDWGSASVLWKELGMRVSHREGGVLAWEQGGSLMGDFWIALAKGDLDAAAGVLEAVERKQGDWTAKLDGYGADPLPLMLAHELVAGRRLTPKAAEAVQKVADAILQKRPKDALALQLLARVAASRNQIAEAVAYQKAAMDQFPANDPARAQWEDALEELSQGRLPKDYSQLAKKLKEEESPRSSVVVGTRFGEPAPPLVGGRWTRGEPVEAWKRGTCYLVYFWNAWPSHREAVLKDFREIEVFVEQMKREGLAEDFVVVAANVSEERKEKAEQMVRDWAPSAAVRVVFDDRDLMSRWWHLDTSRNGPSYHLINSQGFSHGFTLSMGGALLGEGSHLPSGRNPFSVDIRNLLRDTVRRHATETMNVAFESKNWAQAERAISRMEASGVEQKITTLASFHLAVGRGDLEKATSLAEAIQRTDAEPGLLGSCLGALHRVPGPLPVQLLELAHKFASKAKNTCSHAECRPVHLSSLAWTTFQRGQHKEAIQWAERALAESPKDDPEERKLLGDELEAYRQGKMPAPRPYAGFRVNVEVEPVK